MIPAAERSEVEAIIAEALSKGLLERAATSLIEAYGGEILGFILGRLRNEALASDAYSLFLENLWKGLPAFEGRASARVWAYTIARHAALRIEADPARRRSRNVPLSEASALVQAAERIRTETLAYLRTERRERLAELIERLPPDDRSLLALRVSRRLAWHDIAEILRDDGSPIDDAALRRESARLRKRFQIVKERLRRMAGEADP